MTEEIRNVNEEIEALRDENVDYDAISIDSYRDEENFSYPEDPQPDDIGRCTRGFATETR